ncbi:MAG: siroheme synthase CysG [Pseudomonadales bacterium]|nr:siroheme synthase CysG [Pseudomonadales bacterium]
MELLPIFLNIRERACLVVGGGEVARRKISLLLRAGGHVTAVAPEFEPQLLALQDNAALTLLQAEFSAEQLDDVLLVVAATDDIALNETISELARQRGLPVNVVDQPRLCSFIMPAIVDRSPIVIAISSGGSSPVLTRHLKELNEVMVPGRINNLASLLGSKRKTVKQSISSFDERIRFWEAVLDSRIPELVYAGQDEKAEDNFKKLLTQWLEPGSDGKASAGSKASRGEVYLVGAGPGDPDLLTLRALRLMHKADVVFYDRLVSAEILAKLRPDAEKIHVGKQPKDHPVPQERINELLVSHARAGKRVLRLKGGDPFIFGRGGEELAALTESKIPFQVIPGITAASGCAAYAGIPLTHRDHAQSVRFLAGHLKQGELDLDWPHIIAEQQTLVFYMGLVGLPLICEKLIQHGMAASTEVAVVQQGTTRHQRVVTGTLETISGLVEGAGLQAPTLTIIGSVVSLHDELKWFKGDQVENS